MPQCVCGWGSGHDAAKLTSDPKYADIGWYGFARPDAKTTLPIESETADGVLAGNSKNIALLRKLFNTR